MNTSLPVMKEAYERFARPVKEDPYEAYLELHRDHLRQRITRTQLVTLQSTAVSSGTLPPPDLLVANTIGNDVASALYRSFEAKINASQPEIETGVSWIVKKNAEAVFKVLIYTSARAATENIQTSTDKFTANQYCRRVGSTTAKQPIEDSYPWVRMVYERVRLGQTSKALRLIYASVENHFMRQELVALAEILGEIDVHRLNPQTMTAILRISGRAKQALPSWQDLLQRVKAELARLNVPDLPGVMVGLVG